MTGVAGFCLWCIALDVVGRGVGPGGERIIEGEQVFPGEIEAFLSRSVTYSYGRS